MHEREKDSDFQDPRLLVTEHVPWLYRDPKVAHYYGDFVRQCLMAAAALMLLTAPFFGDDLQNELPFLIIGAIVLVALAALTSPWNRTVIMADAIASGVGLMLFELWALRGYAPDQLIVFALRQALAIIFMCAFYFSMKTFRAMLLRQVGQPNSLAADAEPEDAEEEEIDYLKQPANEREAEDDAARRKAQHHKAIHERREYDG